MDTKTQNLIVGLFSLLLLLWLVMFAVPDLFINLFDTPLGNLILIALMILAGMHNQLLGLGLASIFVILFRLSHN